MPQQFTFKIKSNFFFEKKEGGKRKKEGERMTWNVGTVVIPASGWSVTAGGASLAYLVIGIILRHWYHIKALVSC